MMTVEITAAEDEAFESMGGYVDNTVKPVHSDAQSYESIIKEHKTDNVNHPQHYTNHPSGIECIQITEHMNFNLGNAFKYIWRADLKGKAIEDLRKAEFYIKREIARIS